MLRLAPFSLIIVLYLACWAVVLAKPMPYRLNGQTTVDYRNNGDRIRAGLPPMKPRNLFNPDRVRLAPRASPSSQPH